MKDIILLIRQRKEFYLTALVLTLLLTVIGAFYNVSVVGKDFAALNADTITQIQAETMIAEQEIMFREGMSSEHLMRGFFNNLTYVGFVGLNLVIAAVLLLSFSDRIERGAKEFLETLPVKRLALELYNYVALIGIFLINVLTALGIHLAVFSSYNGKIVTLAERFPDLVGPLVQDNLVAAQNAALMYQFGMLTLFLITMITFIYACMSIFKSSVVGYFVGAIIWNTMDDFLFTVRTVGYDGYTEITDSFRKVVSVFDPEMYFEHFEWTEGVCTNAFTSYVAPVLAIMLAVLLFVLVAHAWCRELSKGKIFYVNALNIVMLIAGGFWLFVVIYDWFCYTAYGLLLAVVIPVVAEIVVIMLLYHKKDRLRKLAVKDTRKVNNPVWSQGLRSVLLAAGIIALITEYVDASYNLSYLTYDLQYVNSLWLPQEPWHLSFFDVAYRYDFAAPILVGFVVYKCIQFASERTKAVREFYETLPMSKLRIFQTKLMMDMTVILIPLAVYTAISIGHLGVYNRRMQYLYPELALDAMVAEQFVAAFIVLCVAIALMGVMYLIDAVTVGGGMKDLFCGVTALFVSIFTILMLESNLALWYELIAVYFGDVKIVSIVLNFALGIGMLVAAGYLYVRRDKAKDIFYYKPVKYVFAGMLSFSYLIFVVSSAYDSRALYQYFLGIIGTVLIFFMSVYYCTPGKMAELQKKFKKKKAVK